MAINITRGKSDAIIDGIRAVLVAREADHPAAAIDLYRSNPACVRVIDPDLAGSDTAARHDLFWN